VSKPCDDDDGAACHCCSGDGGDHARRLDWPPAAALSSHYFAERTSSLKPVALIQKTPALMPAEGIERTVSRQFSHSKSPTRTLNHRLQRKSRGTGREILSIVSLAGAAGQPSPQGFSSFVAKAREDFVSFLAERD